MINKKPRPGSSPDAPLTLKESTVPNGPKKSPAVAGYVYAIQSAENPRHVKLGLSSNPEVRLRQLQTGNPYKLKLIWTFPCPNMAELEDRFHKAFDKYRISGSEWFDLRPIDDPDDVWAFLTILAYKYLGREAAGRDAQAPRQLRGVHRLASPVPQFSGRR